MGVSSALAGAVNAVPLGSVTAFAGSAAPAGWQLCYGQAISRTQYAGLFAVTSTTYGVGDGSTTFNLPDLRGRAIAGIDNMGGTDAGRLSTANTAGTTTGTETITLTSAESGVPAHSHVNTLTNNAVTSGAMSANSTHSHHATYSTTLGVAGNSATGAGKIYAGGTTAYENYQQLGSTQDISHTHSVTSNVTITNVNNATANAASAHNNMQPTMVLNYIIKAQ